MRRFVCRFFGHRRSASRAHRVAAGWHSDCRNCGRKLVRARAGRWTEWETGSGASETAFPFYATFAPTGTIIRLKEPAGAKRG